MPGKKRGNFILPFQHLQGRHFHRLQAYPGRGVVVAVFGCRKRNWSLRSIEVRRGEQTATFTRGELAKANAALLGYESLAPTPQAINATSGPRTDIALRGRRTTVIRV